MTKEIISCRVFGSSTTAYGFRMTRKTNTWRGKTAPKRGKCKECGKRGLGPPKATPYLIILRTCRYCGNIEREHVYEKTHSQN